MALKVFVSDGDSYICRALVKKLRADGHTVVTSVRSQSATSAVVDSAAAVQAALDCNVVVLSLLTALNEAESIVEAVRIQASEFAVGNTDEAASKLDDDEGSAAEPPPGYDKTVIAISSTLTWDRSTSMRPPYQEPNYRRRRPGTKSAEVKLAESHVMALGAPERGLRCHVVAAGLPYGDGQGPLQPLFRRAWLCVDAPAATAPDGAPAPSAVGLPLPCLRDDDAANLIPTIHVRDLAAFVAAVVVGSPSAQLEAGQAEYLVAVDEGRDSLRALGLAIARAVGAGVVRLIPKADVAGFFAPEDAPLRTAPATSAAVAATVAAAADDSDGGGKQQQAAAAEGQSPAAAAAPGGGEGASPPPSARVYLGSDPTLSSAMLALLQAHAHFDAGSLSIFTHPQLALPEDQWHCRGGLVAHMDAVAAEFRLWHDLRPLRVVVLGAPTAGKTHAAAVLGAKYHLPVVDARSALATVRTGGNLASLSDGTPEREAALGALREAVDRALGEAEAAAAAAAASASATSTGAPASGKAAPAAAVSKTSRAKAGGTAAAAAAAAASPEEHAAALAAADRPPRIPRALLVRTLRAFLLSPRCRNAGWVLDGFPRTWADAEALFSALPEEDDGVTPGPEDAEPQPREEADETALVVAEATAIGVSVVVGDVVVVSPTVREEAKEGGDGEDGEAPAPEEEDAAALDHTELLAPRELHPALRPTSTLLLDASDAWLEARLSSLPAGAAARNHNSREALHRRLRFSRLHLHSSLTRTPVTWLEAHARQEITQLAAEALWARAQARSVAVGASDAAAAAGDPLSPALEDDRVATAVALRYASSMPSAALTWGLSPEVVTGAAAGVQPLLLPADLPSAAARAFACLGAAELTAVAPANERGGRPHNFHPTPAEEEALARQAKVRAVRISAASRAVELQVRKTGVALRVWWVHRMSPFPTT